MPIVINLRHLEDEDLDLQGELPVAELDLDLRDELIRAEQPLRYDLQIQRLDESLLAQGSLRLQLDCQCVRCLKSFKYNLDLDHWTRHLELAGEEKTPVVNDCVDLTPMVREDILLEFPQHPLCEADCRGLSVGKASKTSDPTPQESSAWAELDKLKLK
ncbi:MAG: hypothetical protein QOD03_713 [Verrucomicrobiota bacterium]|jgi:uncharacterized protein